MGLDKFVLAVIVFSVFFTGGVFLMTDIENSYPDVDFNFDKYDNETYHSINETYTATNTMQSNILGGGDGDDTTENNMFSGAFSALSIIVTPFKLIGNIISTASNALGIPDFLVGAAIAAISVFIIFGLIFIIMRLKA